MSAILLQQKTTLPQLEFGARDHFGSRRFYCVQMHPAREGRKKGSVRRTHMVQESLHVRARFDHKSAAQFAVQRMLDYDVKHLYSVIDQDLEFFFSSLGSMLASE
jgi:hypothetical protein